MALNLAINCIKGYILISLILWVCAGYAYRINSKRLSDDPLKKDLHPASIFLTPVWPLILAAWTGIFILRTVLYAVTLILFTIGLIFIRKPFILIWLGKIAIKVGNKLLQANMLLIRILFPQRKPITEK